MKSIALITAAAALTLGTSAMAYTGVSPQLVADVEATFAEQGITNINVEALTDEQIVEIYAISQGDDENLIGRIEAIAADGGALATVSERRAAMTDMDESGLMPMGENSVVVSVQNFLDKNGYEVDASALSDSQVAELYFLAFSSDMQPENDEIDAILSM